MSFVNIISSIECNENEILVLTKVNTGLHRKFRIVRSGSVANLQASLDKLRVQLKLNIVVNILNFFIY